MDGCLQLCTMLRIQLNFSKFQRATSTIFANIGVYIWMLFEFPELFIKPFGEMNNKETIRQAISKALMEMITNICIV